MAGAVAPSSDAAEVVPDALRNREERPPHHQVWGPLRVRRVARATTIARMDAVEKGRVDVRDL
ncbi:hypothetical protein Lfu02_72090 [Longispora fulva]|nr:hypothetical protein Lfu02_72090 [Longispora fulva]